MQHTQNWKLTLSKRLELEFGGVHCGPDGVIPSAPTSFEQCHTFSS